MTLPVLTTSCAGSRRPYRVRSRTISEALAADRVLAGWSDPAVPERPPLRRAPRDRPFLYRMRVGPDGAHPPIWRRLDFCSDLTLGVVHRVLQAAFGWLDYHLHRFASGAARSSRTRRHFFDGSVPWQKMVAMLGELACVRADGQPLDRRDLSYLEPFDVLWNVGDSPDDSLLSDRVSLEAAALARAALRPGRPTPGRS